MGLDTGMMGATGTDVHKGEEDNQDERVRIDERKVVKSKATQKIQDQVKKAKVTMDIPADSCATVSSMPSSIKTPTTAVCLKHC